LTPETVMTILRGISGDFKRFTTCFFRDSIIERAYIICLKKCLKNSLKFFCLKRLKRKKSEEYSEVLHKIIGHMSEVSSEVLLPLATSDEKV
jgi:hypothetical protein